MLLTADAVGRLVGVSGAAVVSYELGRRCPRPEIMASIEAVTLRRVRLQHFVSPCAGADLPAHATGAGCEATPAPAAGA